MKFPTHAAWWELKRHIYKACVRTHEFVEGQVVSLLDIDGIGNATLRALYKIGVDTADKLNACPTDELLERLASYGVPVGRAERRQEAVERWKEQIGELREQRKNQGHEPG